MAIHRRALPQLGGAPFLTDGGLETTLLFHEELDFPDFCAFDLLRSPEGKAALLGYFGTYAKLAERFSTGLILESATWRANRDWGEKLGYGREELATANREAIRLLEMVRKLFTGEATPTAISGCVGPRGDGYRQIKESWPQLNVLGGCCGTDHRHVEKIALVCCPLF